MDEFFQVIPIHLTAEGVAVLLRGLQGLVFGAEKRSRRSQAERLVVRELELVVDSKQQVGRGGGIEHRNRSKERCLKRFLHQSQVGVV